MAMSRSFGGRSVTSRSPIQIAPALISSRSTSIRSEVDFPQPDGPTRTMNSPSPISRLSLSTEGVVCTRVDACCVLERNSGHATLPFHGQVRARRSVVEITARGQGPRAGEEH